MRVRYYITGVFLTIVASLLFFYGYSNKKDNLNGNPTKKEVTNETISTKKPNRSPKNGFTYQLPELPDKESYTIIIVGDSMVDVMGDNVRTLRTALSEYYPDKTFGIFNYGFGATTLETLMDRLTTETENKGRKFTPILSRQSDIIIIESFGHNPISSNLDEGLDRQENLLLEAVQRISSEHPGSVIIFLSTIGANTDHYGKTIIELRNADSQELAGVRNAYIKNHIEFAKNHNIPFVDVYTTSLNSDGKTDPTYINKNSWIHPSYLGVELISNSIADLIYEQEIIPLD